MEFADVYASYGTKVTIVEALDRILPLEDAEISKFMERVYKKRGMDIHTGAFFEKAQVRDDGVTVSFKDKPRARSRPWRSTTSFRPSVVCRTRRTSASTPSA